MCDEKPLILGKRPQVLHDLSANASPYCIVHFIDQTGDKIVRPLTETSFETIQNSAEVRQQKGTIDQKLDYICDNLPSEFDVKVHGHHCPCYRRFTNTSKILKRTATDDAEGIAEILPAKVRTSSRSTATSSISSPLLPQDKCIYCDKERKSIGHGFKENLAKCLTKEAESRIIEAATISNDYVLLGKISGMDLIAREARYHDSCRRNSTRCLNVKESENKDPLFGERRPLVILHIKDCMITFKNISSAVVVFCV